MTRRWAVSPHGLWFPSRKLSTFNMYMETHGYNMEQIWRDMEDVIIKTIISAHPIIKHNYHTCFPNHTLNSACFEILGFDILLDHKLKPWLLEVEGMGLGVKIGCCSWGSAGVRLMPSSLVQPVILINFLARPVHPVVLAAWGFSLS